MKSLKRIKKKLRKYVKKGLIFLYHILYRVLSVNPKVVVFDSNIGLNYTGNPRAIYEKMVQLGLDKKYQCIWFFQRGKEPKEWVGSAKKIRYGRIRYLYYMCIAGIWIFDSRQPRFIKKKQEAHYIQTWHGTPLKKLALDMEQVNMARSRNIERYKENFRNNTKTWDYLIAQNTFSAEIFRRAFAFEKKMLCTGYPRNDILFHKNSPEAIKELKRRFRLPEGKKILLYAPTWRDDEYDETGVYEFRPKLDFTKLRQALEKEFIIIVKYHYLIGDKIDWSGFSGFVYPFTSQAEISELYLVSDALITDYSSVMFDYSLLHRPMYFYTYDLEKYKNELRGFYFDFLKEAPGPISLTTEELIKDLLIPQEELTERFEQKRETFYKKYHTYEKGTASEQIIKLMDSFQTE